MSNLDGYIKKMAEEVNEKNKRSRGSEKRLTVILSEYDHRRLKYISKTLGEPASTFARNLLMQALNDAERILNLKEWNDEPDYFDDDDNPVYFHTEYGHYINSVGDDDDDEDQAEDVNKKRKTTTT